MYFFLIVLLLVSFGISSFLFIQLNKQKANAEERFNSLQNKFLALEEKFILSQEHLDFKKNLELKWDALFQEMQVKLQEKLQSNTQEISGNLVQFKSEWLKNFTKELDEQYKKAVASIAFHTVEYKKTITKKRREFSKKNPAINPQKEIRSIDDE